MTVAALDRPATGRVPGKGGGVAARRAVVRWAWRLFRREWRQQVLVLALVVMAVAATIVGSAAALDSPAPAASGFGTAQDMATFSGAGPRLAAQVAALQHRFGTVDVVENQQLTVPGSVDTFDLRAQNPHGAFGSPMLSLLSGRYPTTAGEVALTPGLASELGITVGDDWRQGGTTRRVVGIVQNPQSLLDEFALVVPGQVTAPTQTTVLFDAPGVAPASIGPNVTTPSSQSNNNSFNPTTISLAVLTIGMLLIALTAVGGFTVLAQRRLRSLGMLATVGATDEQVGLVVRANGVVVGVAGAVLGAVLGVVVWLLYRPHLEASSHHAIGVLALDWSVVAVAVVLAVVATYFAASRPARAVTRIPVVAALSGRPPAPRQVHRSAIPGVVCFVIAFLLLGYSGSRLGAGSSGAPELVLGLVFLIPGMILLAPFFLSVLSWVGRRAPVALRIALRDLARYRARSGSALAAISLGVMIAMVIALVAAARYGNVLDYAGPNLASNQLMVYTPNGPYDQGGPTNTFGSGASAAQLAAMTTAVDGLGSSLGAQHVLELETTTADLQHTGPGRQFSGPIFVATPQLLRAFGIPSSAVDPDAVILSMRPGLSGVSDLQLTYSPPTPIGNGGVILNGPGSANSSGPGDAGPGSGGAGSGGCTTADDCLPAPVIQEVGALPSGTSAPNTVLTEHAVHTLRLPTAAAGWLLETAQPLTAAQIHNARAVASATGLTVETKNDLPSSWEVIDWATVFGIALALCILAMSVGLIRSETGADLRTLTAAGASSRTRRTLTATTAGGLGLLGAVLGTLAAYLGVIGWLRDNSLNGGISSLSNVPVVNLALVVVGMPLAAATVGWLLAGREPSGITHQPIE